MPNLAPNTYPAYFNNYISKVEAETVPEAITKYAESLNTFFTNIPSDKHLHRYAPEKWSIKEVLQHVTDTERIFGYRALRIARKDKTPLPGFDENAYAKAASNTNERSWHSLVDEFVAVRKSTDLLLESFTEEQLNESGITNNNPTTVKSIAFVVFGHILHHKQILEERYF